MKTYPLNMKRFYLAALSIALLTIGCTESWDDHYAKSPEATVEETLWDQLLVQDNLSDFRAVLDSVKVMNGRKITHISYATLLQKQFFTVFAPVNGTFNKDSLLALCATYAGNDLVEKRFVMNHLTRTPYSYAAQIDKMARMLNGKYLPFKDESLAGAPIVVGQSNILARNGLIHVVSAQVPYVLNIYESLMYLPQFESMGQYLFTYEKDSLDEITSVNAGLNQDGVIEYIDSVLIEKNELLNYFGFINSEDSAYRMVAPTKAGWDRAYAKAAAYYNFAYIPGADSLKKYWTNFSLMKDLFFNWNLQDAPNDSLITMQYRERTPELHVFYKPFETGGILANARPLQTSNGLIYEVDEWPYDFEQVFFTPIVVEAEIEKNIHTLDKEKFKFYQRQKFADSISNDGYLSVFPIRNTDKPDITYNIPNTLSGKYDVCVVILPKTVYDPKTTDFKPLKFSARLNFNLTNGTASSVTCRGKEGQNLSSFENNPYRVDTITLTTMTFPTCNYNQNKVTVQVRLQSVVTPKEMTRFSQDMYIDCFYLKPRQD